MLGYAPQREQRRVDELLKNASPSSELVGLVYDRPIVHVMVMVFPLISESGPKDPSA
jgi:hypothetical protein